MAAVAAVVELQAAVAAARCRPLVLVLLARHLLSLAELMAVARRAHHRVAAAVAVAAAAAAGVWRQTRLARLRRMHSSGWLCLLLQALLMPPPGHH